MVKEIGMVNTAMSKGDMPARRKMRAQKMASKKS
jgi:hypothetical protein